MVPRFLLVDIGNTRLKWCDSPASSKSLMDGLRLKSTRTSVQKPARADERFFHTEVRSDQLGHLETAKVTATAIRALAKRFPHHQVVMASVVPKVVPWFEKAFRGRLHVFNATSPALKLKFNYPNPVELGADRLAAAVAIQSEAAYPAIIVQCGTATAVSLLNSQGRFCGGMIVPGPQIQLSSLRKATAQLPELKFALPTERIPGRSTEEAMRSGVLISFQGGVKDLIGRSLDRMGGEVPPKIFVTGGNAFLLTGMMDEPYTLRPLLVFEGLHIIGTRIFSGR